MRNVLMRHSWIVHNRKNNMREIYNRNWGWDEYWEHEYDGCPMDDGKADNPGFADAIDGTWLMGRYALFMLSGELPSGDVPRGDPVRELLMLLAL